MIDAVKRGQKNLLAVRVPTPTREPIDGFRLEEVAEGRRGYPTSRDNAYSTGGITGLWTFWRHLENRSVLPVWKPGKIRILATLRNASKNVQPVRVTFVVAPARGENTAGCSSSNHDGPCMISRDRLLICGDQAGLLNRYGTSRNRRQLFSLSVFRSLNRQSDKESLRQGPGGELSCHRE